MLGQITFNCHINVIIKHLHLGISTYFDMSSIKKILSFLPFKNPPDALDIQFWYPSMKTLFVTPLHNRLVQLLEIFWLYAFWDFDSHCPEGLHHDGSTRMCRKMVTLCLWLFKKKYFNTLICFSSSIHPQMWDSESVPERKPPYALLSVAVSSSVFLCIDGGGEMSLLITPRFRLFVFYGELWETEKSGLKEGANVRGNWRWQMIVENWKSCREDVALEDEVLQ